MAIRHHAALSSLSSDADDGARHYTAKKISLMISTAIAHLRIGNHLALYLLEVGMCRLGCYYNRSPQLRIKLPLHATCLGGSGNLVLARRVGAGRDPDALVLDSHEDVRSADRITDDQKLLVQVRHQH